MLRPYFVTTIKITFDILSALVLPFDKMANMFARTKEITTPTNRIDNDSELGLPKAFVTGWNGNVAVSSMCKSKQTVL